MHKKSQKEWKERHFILQVYKCNTVSLSFVESIKNLGLIWTLCMLGCTMFHSVSERKHSLDFSKVKGHFFLICSNRSHKLLSNIFLCKVSEK